MMHFSKYLACSHGDNNMQEMTHSDKRQVKKCYLLKTEQGVSLVS